MRGLRKNNKGYSLVELIIVVAIIAVIGLGATWSIILVFSANAKTCSNDIVNAIAECKIMTMTKGQGNVRLIIYRDGAGGTIYGELQTRETASSPWTTIKDEKQKIGASRCSVGTSDGADDIPTGPDGAWGFYFDRSTGKLLNPAEAGITNVNDTTYVDEMHVLGGRKKYLIQIEKLTGKVTKKLR